MINPVSGERFVWRHTANSTAGEFIEFDLFLDEGATVAAPHIHPRQREDFRVEGGALSLRVGDEERILGVGDEDSVPPGTPHAWGQTGSGQAHVVVRLTPAMRSEEFFETFCGLARDGKANRRGLPRNLLQFAVLAHEYREEFALPSAPARAIVGPIIGLLAAIGRRRGFRSRYPGHSTD